MYRRSGWWIAALFIAALAAFWPQYLRRLPEAHAAAHTHALLMTCWLGLLVVQPLLIGRERRALHRAIGRLTYAVIPLTTLAAIWLSHTRLTALPAPRFESEAPFVILAVGAQLNLLAYYGLAVFHRRRTPLHARYMLATALTLVDPVLARLLAFYAPPLPAEWLYALGTWVLVGTLCTALALRDRALPAPVRGAWWRILAIFAACQAPVFIVAPTAWWLAAVTWFRDLPLTGR